MEEQSQPKKRGRPKSIKPAVNNSQDKQYDLSWGHSDKTPSVLIQSALFGISKQREEVVDYKIPAIGNIEIRFKGELFSQFELDVFQGLIELAHKKNSPDFSFKLVELIKVLGKKNEVENKEAIHKSIHRLAISRFTINSDKIKFSGGLVNSYKQDKDDNHLHHISISNDTLNLFINSSEYNSETRNSLKGNLAKFYYMFFCSHKNYIFDYKLKTYLELSNSSLELKNFKRLSKKAFDELNEKTHFNSEIVKSTDNEDFVVVRSKEKA
jgi:hypothetical protein